MRALESLARSKIRHIRESSLANDILRGFLKSLGHCSAMLRLDSISNTALARDIEGECHFIPPIISTRECMALVGHLLQFWMSLYCRLCQ